MIRLVSVFVFAVSFAAVSLSADAMPGGGKMGDHGGYGQPLPSAELAVGELTVKVVGQNIADKKVGVDVELVHGAAVIATSKTNAEGRARFKGLEPGKRYVARIKNGANVIESQSIACPAQGGVRVLLAMAHEANKTPSKTTGEPSAGHPGKGRGTSAGASKSGDAMVSLDTKIPAGTVVVSAVQGASKLANVAVSVVRGQERFSGVTDKTGAYRVALSVKNAPLTAEVRYQGARYVSNRLRTVKDGGLQIVFRVFEKTGDKSKLSFGGNSHVLGEVRDDSLSMMQVLVLRNAGNKAFDPGPNGVRIPFAEGVNRGSIPNDMKPYLRLAKDKKAAILYRPVPPGTLRLRMSYSLPHDGPLLEFRQKLPFKMNLSLFAVTNTNLLELRGAAIIRREMRPTNQGKVAVFVLKPVAAGEMLEFTIDKLPYRSKTPVHVVLALTVLLALWAAFESLLGKRAHLERKAQRDALLEQLTTLTAKHEAGEIERKSFEKRQRGLLAKLENVWDD
jgi:hypothetical protein